MPPPSRAGWYRDPEDPVQLRHYNGRGWDTRRRTLPAWALGVTDFVVTETSRREGDPRLDGPVQRAALPAIANATATSSRPARSPRGPGSPVGERHAAGVGGRAPSWSGGTRPVRRAPWYSPRAAFLVSSTLVGLLIVILVATVGLANRPPFDPSLAQDATFIRAANIDCSEAMGAVRLPVPLSGPAASESATTVATANQDLTRLAARIRNLPVVASAQALVQNLLDYWARYAADRQREVTALATSAAATGQAAALSSTVSLDEAQADAIVTANGLGACRLATSSPLLAS